MAKEKEKNGSSGVVPILFLSRTLAAEPKHYKPLDLQRNFYTQLSVIFLFLENTPKKLNQHLSSDY